MSADDPLAGLPRPLGDPAVTSGAGRKYTAAADQLGTDSRQLVAVVKSLAAQDWIGLGSTSAVGCTVVLGGGVQRAASAAHTAGSALTAFSTALSSAQSDWDHARRLADQAVSDEASYRSSAEQSAKQLDVQAATGDIGAAHQANAIRSDAASYQSPLRARAVSLATTARQDAQRAGTTAAGRVSEAAAMVPAPPAPPGTSSGVDAGKGDGGDSLFKWFNDYVLGGSNTTAALLTAPSAAFAAGKWAIAAKSAAGLPRDLQTLFDTTVGPLALAADRGELPWSAVAMKAANFGEAATLFDGASASEVNAARLSFLRGGLPDSPIVEVAGKGLGVLGIVGDAGVMIDPGGDSTAENDVNRGMAGANAVSTIIVLNAATDEIPVAGEVVMVGSGVYLGGDWLYHHWTPFHTGVDATGNFVVHTVPNFVTHDIPSGLSTAAHYANPLNW